MINNKIVRRLALLLLVSTDTSCYVRANETAQAAGKLRSLAEIAVSEHRFEEAVSYYSQAIQIEPSNASNYYKLFRVHNRMRNYVSALSDISKAVEADPKQAEYRLQKAKLLVNLGRCDDAIEQYQVIHSNSIAAAGPNPGLNTDEQAGYDDASHCAEKVNAATAAFSKQDYNEARRYFDMALSHMEQAPDLLFMKAQAQYYLGDYFGVVSDTGKILKVHSQNIAAYQLRGEAYFRIGEHDVAVQHFREGLKLDPEHSGCKSAHKLVKSIMKKDKKGDDLIKAGKVSEAIEYWWQAINIDSTHRAFARPTILKIVQAYTKSGDHVKAVEKAEEHVEEEETLEGLFALGDAQMGGDKFQEAITTFQKAMEFEVSCFEYFAVVYLLVQYFPTNFVF